MSQTKTVTHRTKAFSTESAANYKFQVDGKEVRVWDSVAGHYTICHSVSPAAQKRIIAKASK